ncbi:MAG TPA: DUF4115 domain-containing protein [Erythrobacter sp.]|nr:DUF4115 domain-containing protein [Erythrobacter sp.]
MEEVEEEVAEELPLESAGQMLRRVRNEQGLTIGEIAEKTRIPTRHLDAIENGEFTKLPARTYAIGFSRTYAQVLGLDESEVADLVRGELAPKEDSVPGYLMSFEPGDPGKVPSRGLAWATAIAALVLMIGAGSYFAQRSGIGIGPDPIVADVGEMDGPQVGQIQGEQVAETTQAITSDGQVAFTALEDGVWVRFYDTDGRRLMEKQMAAGERFEIPLEAESPRIWTGRPDAFAITIDGRPVPKLAEEESVMRDVVISAEALLARNDGSGAIVNN